MLVDRIFTSSVVRAPRSMSLQEAAALMRERHVGCLVVTEDGIHSDRPVGIVTDRDLVIRALAEGLSPQRASIGEVMTQALATVLRTDRLSQALELMRSRGVRRLAVAEADGELAGMLSLDDILDALAAQIGGMQGIVGSELAREISSACTSVP
jgi:CBS domain-containing protein